ncbi:uncharacterized protein CEXT_272091 [Caerostris extrusa]|uniref:Uncharacterized protein n=1 Tax=Caerostris extrusa TaxID=172846 RepID=A0AAV4P1Q2_CAEEX|nr:uncharacterized protein CEXT_272091 [Caerostris extrusa]
MAKPTFATITKTVPNKAPKQIPQTRPINKPKFITTIKPMEKEVTSITTKKAIQNAIDVNTMNIAIKNVRNINNGGILIETDSEKDLERLINEFKAKDALNASYQISRTVARKPQIICFEVSTDTGETQLVEGLRKQFSDPDTGLEDDFAIKHHYQTKRGVNWIVEINPQIFTKVIKSKKLNLGWERIGFKENYKIIAHQNSPKAAILIQDSIDCQVVFINQLLVIIDVHSAPLNCLLISIYCPPRDNLLQQLSILQAWIEKFPEHRIMKE